jgi:phenylpyruvate tautomerase PptA (4-oxalocrotonate tautomerase family)
MAKLTDVLMWWEKEPDTPKARGIMKGWVYEVDADADYSGGRPDHDKPGLIRDFTQVILDAENATSTPENARRVWVTIHEIKRDDWGVGGHTDWLRDYTSALDETAPLAKPAQ